MNLTPAKEEAYINEWKGNLFEFLVAQGLAERTGVFEDFILGVPEKLRGLITTYQRNLLKLSPETYRELPALAENVTDSLSEFLPVRGMALGNTKVILEGKFDFDHKSDKAESDILLIQNSHRFPISLKLCKENSYVNTKSGGVKSFVSKYFSEYKSCQKDQQKISQKVDFEFQGLGHELYSQKGLSFMGKFDEQWEEAGGAVLPGELSTLESQILRQYYYKIILEIYSVLKKYFEEDKEIFSRSLMPILGMGKADLIQATCFHSGTKDTSSSKAFL